MKQRDSETCAFSYCHTFQWYNINQLDERVYNHGYISTIHVVMFIFVYKGRTALFTAAEEGWSNIVPVLVSAGENIEETDITGETPLIAATKNGFSNTIKVFGSWEYSTNQIPGFLF